MSGTLQLHLQHEFAQREEWLGEMEAERVNCALKYDGLEPGVLNTILYFQGQFRIQDVDKLKR